MRKIKLFGIVSVLFIGITAVTNAQDLPPTAQPGKCYVKCITSDEYKDITETIVVKPAYKVLRVVPATYKTVEERVLVKEASKSYVIHPAEYADEVVNYESKAPETSLTVVPASFRTDTKVIETQPKSGRWEYKQMANCLSANKEDCMVACFIEHPPVTEAVPISVLVSDATTRQSEASKAITASYKKRVVKTPARVEEIAIPAEYATIKKIVIDQPARTEEQVVPAVTKTITKKELVKKGGITVWQEVDCDKITPASVSVSVSSSPTILPIYYDYNSASITPASAKIIDEHLLSLMVSQPNVRIEIASHTDSRGNDDYNMALSQQRAQSVVNYLVSKGISRDRLEAKGYGETRLINRCANGVNCSEAEHQQNRRTEFRIIP